MAAYTPESESQEILSQQQKDLITQSSSSSTIDEQQHQQCEQERDSINEDDDDEVIVWKPQPRNRKPKKRAPQVCLEGYVEPSDDDDLPRTKSLTDDDLDELKGCVDLGFGFSYDEIPELCNTLPALELCYSMSQKFLDDHPNQQQQQFHNQSGGIAKNGSGAASDTASSSGSESSSPMPTWKISSPGDHPEDVKARLKFWAQAVACTCVCVLRVTIAATSAVSFSETSALLRLVCQYVYDRFIILQVALKSGILEKFVRARRWIS